MTLREYKAVEILRRRIPMLTQGLTDDGVKSRFNTLYNIILESMEWMANTCCNKIDGYSGGNQHDYPHWKLYDLDVVRNAGLQELVIDPVLEEQLEQWNKENN